MLTQADYLRQQLAINDREIAEAEVERTRRKESLDKVESHLDNLHVRRMRLEGELEREEAPLKKVQPTGATCDGWKI